MATTPDLIKTLLTDEVTFEEYLTPAQFEVEFNSEIDDEAREHLISLLAAEDSLELNGNKAGFVIAADLSDDQLNGEAISLNFKQVAALLYTEDGEELSWYAPEEIEHQISGWLK